jgi:hypothetical protein
LQIEFGSCFWIFASSRVNVDLIVNVTRPNFESKVYTASYVDDTVEITEHYAISPRFEVTSRLVEVWSLGEHDHARKVLGSEYIWERRKNLQGIHFRAGVVNFSPYSIIPDGKVGEAYGFSIDILNVLSDAMNFR